MKKNLLTIMLTIVNEGSSLMIVNETTNFNNGVFGKTVVLEKKLQATLLNVALHEVKQLLGS